jgi:hypothetical protein
MLAMVVWTFLNVMAENKPDILIDSYMTHHMDVLLRGWKPDHRLKKPKATLINPDVDLQGTWVTATRMDYSTLAFEKSAGGYTVRFVTGGCLGQWKLYRTAMCSHGVITLSAPIRPYRPGTYQTLYAIKVGGIDYLLPSCDVEQIQNGTVPLFFDGYRRKPLEPKT